MHPIMVRQGHRSTGVRRWVTAGAVAGAILALTAKCDFSQNGQSTQQLANPQPGATPAKLMEANSRLPDANAMMEVNGENLKRAKFEAANLERKRQMSADSVELLKLAAELKAEVDKTAHDTLSMNEVKRAEEIERLAHDVQVKMKLTAPAS